MSKIQELMQQEITRQEFLRYVGVALLGVIGVTALLQNLTDSFTKQTTVIEKKEAGGYGASPYGR